jgi:hypothetical protein
MTQIKDFPQKLIVLPTDKLLIQGIDGITNYITKENFFTGIGTSNFNRKYDNQVLFDVPIIYLPLIAVTNGVTPDISGFNKTANSSNVTYSGASLLTGLTDDKSASFTGTANITLSNPFTSLSGMCWTFECLFAPSTTSERGIICQIGNQTADTSTGGITIGVGNGGLGVSGNSIVVDITWVTAYTAIAIGGINPIHLAVTFDSLNSNKLIVYVNGKYARTDTFTPRSTFNSLISIGNIGNTAFNGRISRAAFYDYVLPENRIKTHALMRGLAS